MLEATESNQYQRLIQTDICKKKAKMYTLCYNTNIHSEHELKKREKNNKNTNTKPSQAHSHSQSTIYPRPLEHTKRVYKKCRVF